MKTKITIFAFALLLLLPVGFASAYEIKTSETTAIIESTETIQDDLMIAGQSVQIDGVVSGDIYAAGQTVNISSNAKILGNAFIAAQTVNIDGVVEGDLFAAGADVSITGSVKNGIIAFAGMISVNPKEKLDSNNASFFGGTVDLGKNANFSRDLIINGGVASVNAAIDNNLTINAGTIEFNGQVKNNAIMEASEKITFDSNAKVDGNLEYTAPKQAQFKNGAQVSGETKWTPLTSGQKKAKKSFFSEMFAISAFNIAKGIICFIGLLVVSIIIATICKKYSLIFIDHLKNKTWASLGWGVLILFATPIVMIFLLITVIGIPLSLLLLPAYILIIYFAKVFASICTGYWIIKSINKKEPNLIWSAVLGVIVLSIIMTVPFIGFLAKIAIIALGIGGIVLALRAYSQKTSTST